MNTLETGTGPIMSGTDPIMESWPVDGIVSEDNESTVQTIKETVMNILSQLHTSIEQTLATCSPLGFIIVRKNYDRTPAAFSGVGPI